MAADDRKQEMDAANTLAMPSEKRTQLMKEAFGRRVHNRMIAKGLTQSELGRRAGLDRARISTYVRGQSIPSGLSLHKLAEALGTTPTDLLPEVAISDEAAPYSMVVSPDGKRMRIIADVTVPTPVGAQIIQLLSEHAASDRE